MNVVFYVSESPLREQLVSSIREVFRAAAELTGDTTGYRTAVTPSDVVLIDITAATSRSAYILGLAEALSKQTVLMAPHQEAIPAAFADRRAIVHAWNLDYLKAELQKIGDAAGPATPNDDSPAGQFHRLFGDLLRKHGYHHSGTTELDKNVFTLREQEMELALVQEIANRAKTLNVRVRLL